MDFRVVKAGDRGALERMISRGETSPSSLDKDKNSLLHLAVEVQKCTQGLIDLLLANGWNLNAQNALGATPLHYVALRRDSGREVALLLLARGASLDTPTYSLHTPLHLACERQKPELVSCFLNAGANANSLDCNNNSPLHAALLSGGRDTVAKEITELLIAKGCKLNVPNNEGDDPLLLAMGKGLIRVCQLLLSHNVDSLTVNKQGNSTLHKASDHGYSELSEMLLGVQPALLNLKNFQGDTPLHLAVRSNYTDVVVSLMRRGASLAIRNNAGETPVDLATADERDIFATRHPDLVRVITSKQRPKKKKEEPEEGCVVQ